MNEINTKDQIEDSKSSNKQFEIILKVCLIIGILIVSGFIIFYLITPEPGYVTFGILNENQEAENYPTKASVNETISFYLTVGNYLNREFSFRFKIMKGNNETNLSSSGSNGTLYRTIGNFTLENNIEQVYGSYNISFSEIGENQIIIAELWQIKNTVEQFYIILLIRLNITN